MALNIFTGSAASVNWSATSSWTLARIPTSTDGDTAYFGPLSPTCSVDLTNAPCYNFDCSTYTRQINMLQNINIYGTYSNFGSSASLRATAAYSLPGSVITWYGTCSITSNGYAFKREGGASNPPVTRFDYNNVNTTITLLDQFETTSFYVSPQTGTPQVTFNGATISIRETFTTTSNANMVGTSNIQLRATASSTTTTMSIFSSNPITNNVYVNSPGIVNLSVISMRTNNNTFKYISGSLSITLFYVYPGTGLLTYDNSANTLINTLFIQTVATTATASIYSVQAPINATSIIINGGPGGGVIQNNYIYGGFTCSIFTYLVGNNTANGFLYLSPTGSHYISSSIQAESQKPINTPTKLGIYSAVPGTKAPLTVNYNATQSLFQVIFNDIDASSGATLLPYNVSATFSNVTNIQDLKAYYIATNQIQIN